MDTLDIDTPHYEKKIADLQKRLDVQYDTIFEVEQSIATVKAQVMELKKSNLSADSMYEFLLHFHEIYEMCTDAEKKRFMHSIIERIELFPERREDDKDYVIFSHHSFTNQFHNRAVRNGQEVFDLIKGKNILLTDLGSVSQMVMQIWCQNMNTSTAMCLMTEHLVQ